MQRLSSRIRSRRWLQYSNTESKAGRQAWAGTQCNGAEADMQAVAKGTAHNIMHSRKCHRAGHKMMQHKREGSPHASPAHVVLMSLTCSCSALHSSESEMLSMSFPVGISCTCGFPGATQVSAGTWKSSLSTLESLLTASGPAEAHGRMHVCQVL